MSTAPEKKYFAFISYNREDEVWAKWFQHELENYHLPPELKNHTDLPNTFRPVFRDIDELKAGNLPEQIYNALALSAYLIVICSPNSAKSEWVNKEIKDFIEIGKTKGTNNIRNILPFIVSGQPRAKNKSEECFPRALLELPSTQEIVGGNINEGNIKESGNVNENGRDKAFVKVLAGMLPNVAFDELWNRYEKEKAKEEQLKREERERFLSVQSRFVAEKAIDISHDSSLAQCLALEVLPKELGNPNRPFTIEAEKALRQAAFQHRITLNGHTHDINDLSFSSDGKQIASISDDYTIRIWNTETGSLIRVLNTGHPFGHCVSFTSDDKLLFAVFGDGALIIWDVNTWKHQVTMDFNQVFNTKRPASSISSMAISSDSNRLAISTLEGDIFLLDFITEETLYIKIEPVLSISFSPDGKRLVSTSYDGLIIWDLEDGARGDISLNKGIEPEHAIAHFSVDGKRIAFLFENTIGLLDVAENGRAQTFGENRSMYVSISFCNDEKYLATVSEDGELIVWDIETQLVIYKSDGVHGEVNHATYALKGNRVGLVVDKKTIVIQDVLPSAIINVLIENSNPIGAISYSPNKKQIVTSSVAHENGELTIWDVDTGRITRKLEGHTDRVWSVSYSPNGKHIVSASYDGSVRVWDTVSGKTIKTLTIDAVINEHTGFTAVAFSPDGEKIVASTYNGFIVIWDMYNDIIIHILKHSSNPIWSVSYSPDGNCVVSASLNMDIKVWDVGNGILINTLKGHTGSVNSVAYCPNGKWILSAGDDKTIVVWDSATGEIVKKMGIYLSNTMLDPFDTETKKRTDTLGLINYANVLGLMGQQAKGITTLSCNQDGKYIVSALTDGTLTIWDVENGYEVVTLSGYSDSINCVKFSPDGKQIASVSVNGVIIIWDFPPIQELIDQTRERFKDRPFTDEERKTYYLE